MSYLKHAAGLADACTHCGGAGELYHPISIPTSNPNYPGYAYDEHVEPCSACSGTGENGMAPAHLEQAAEEHELITTQQEEQAWTPNAY